MTEDVMNTPKGGENFVAPEQNEQNNEKIPEEEDAMEQNEKSEVTVGVGMEVLVQNLDVPEEEPWSWIFVESDDANPVESLISIESPVGMGILGKAIGEIAEIQVPAGIARFKVLDIKPISQETRETIEKIRERRAEAEKLRQQSSNEQDKKDEENRKADERRRGERHPLL